MEKPRISIIGAGPAGIASALQLRRYGYDPLVFEKNRIGGLLWNANLIENYPGFPNGISGPQLIRLMDSHLAKFDIQVIMTSIKRLTFSDGSYLIESVKEDFRSDFIVIATGTKPKKTPLSVAEDLKIHIHYDIFDLLDTKGKMIFIIGAGDAAFDQAINLARKNKVTILNRGAMTKSIPLLVHRALTNKNIVYIKNVILKKISLNQTENQEEKKLIAVRAMIEAKEFQLECDDVVFAIGREPQLDFIGQYESTNKCFLIGDVKNGIFRQVTIAISDGILAAMKIHNLISGEDLDESICRNR
jgi:thioredoxin reductase (NADPH)